MNDLPSRLTRLAHHLENKAKLSEAFANDHAVNKEAQEALRMRKRAENARAFATDCIHAAKLLTARAKRAAFVPPTLNQALAYARDYHPAWPFADVEAWWSHFESNGWLVSGKARMQDWHAAAANGYRRWLKDNPQSQRAARVASDPDGWREFLAANGRPYKAYALESGWVRTEFEQKRKA